MELKLYAFSLCDSQHMLLIISYSMMHIISYKDLDTFQTYRASPYGLWTITRILNTYVFLLFWLTGVKNKFQTVGQVTIFDYSKVTVMFYYDYKTSYITIIQNRFKKYIFSRWSHLGKTLNVKLISVEYSKLWNFPGKNYENLFEIVQNFLFDSAYVIFHQFSIYGKNSDPIFDYLYMWAHWACQHDEKLKLHDLMKISDFRNL